MLADVISIFVYEVPCIFWRYINVDEVSLITLKTLLQSAMDLLQIATGITKCDDYYKLRQYRHVFKIPLKVTYRGLPFMSSNCLVCAVVITTASCFL